MRDCGVTYVQACRIYDTMVNVVEDGVCAGAAIRFGKVGVIHPVRMPPRTVSQNVRMTKGRKAVPVQHIYNLGPRIVFKFRLFRQFMASHTLNWFNEM
jgi:hypothetical protein